MQRSAEKKIWSYDTVSEYCFFFFDFCHHIKNFGSRRFPVLEVTMMLLLLLFYFFSLKN